MTTSTEHDFSTLSDNPSIGEVHNYLLYHAHTRKAGLKSGTEEGKTNLHQVVTYWLELDYFKEQNLSEADTHQIYSIVERLVSELQMAGVRTTEEVSEFLNNKVSTETLRSSEEAQAVYQDIYKHSTIYWDTKYGVETRAKSNKNKAIIAADAAGGLWGLWLGGVGSIIAGAVASFIADDPSMILDGPTWKENPKYM